MLSSAPQSTASDMGRLRLMTKWIFGVFYAVFLAAVTVAQHSGLQAAIVGLASVVALAVCLCWEQPPRRAMVVMGLLFGVLAVVPVWVAGGNAAAGAPLGVVLGVLVSYLPHHAAALVLSPVFVAGITAVITQDPHQRLPNGLVIALVLLATAAVYILNRYIWTLVQQVDDGRTAAAEVSRLSERARLADDLHDIQGQNMTTMRMKLTVAERMLERDPARTRRELAEVQEMMAGTTRQTKELIAGSRILSLSSELANAQFLLQAAGATVDVERDINNAPVDERLVARLVREATTNILKHATAQHVRFDLGFHHVKVTNDGVSHTLRPLGGLGSLQRQIEAVGGTLVVAVRSNTGEHGAEKRVFELTATLPGKQEKR